MEITCPSGLKLDVRAWNNNDQLELIDSKNTILRMAEIATLKCIDPGPYSFKADSRPAWSEVSIADMSAANVMIRGLTDKGRYELERQCQFCRQQKGIEINCRDVEIFPASEEGIAHLQTGNPILRQVQTATAGKVELSLRILRGQHMEELDRYQKQDKKTGLKALTCLSIQSVNFLERTAPNGEPQKPLTSIRSIMDFWEKESWGITTIIRDAIETAEGSPDMVVEWVCDEFGCGGRKEEQYITVPLDLVFYGLDLEGKLVRRHKRSLAARSAGLTSPSDSTI